MPPRKEPKESVVYPSSKRKTPAFKPLRPAKVPRIATTESESSVKSRPAAKKAPSKKPAAESIPLISSDNEDEDDDLADLTREKPAADDDDDDSETLEDDPLAASKKKPLSKPAPKATATARRPAIRAPSPMSISSSEHQYDPPETTSKSVVNEDPMPTQSDPTPSTPQPLLIRLLHESFADKNTKIDKQAIQVFHKYVEVFVREAIARTKAEKEEASEKGEVAEADVGWLEVEDLEKVVPGMVLDFL